jgi:Fe-Mn family superoxide dismutase
MTPFQEQSFTIPSLVGLSEKSIAEHVKLYSGYVKHANLILEKIEEYKKDAEKNAYVLGELQRRFGFEFNGMRNHEYYFRSLEGGAKELSPESPLYKAMEKEWGSFDVWLNQFKSIALTRGIGWAWLYYDKVSERLLVEWVDEQHLGHLMGATPILGIDMWEHSFVSDYQPSGKKQYIEDFFKNLNWSVVEKNFTDATK